ADRVRYPAGDRSNGIVLGDFDGDGRDDLAFHRPGVYWRTLPVLFAERFGSWDAETRSIPSWAHQSGVVAVPGDYDADGLTDVAFHRPGSSWSTVPTAFSNGDGSWWARNEPAPSWANQPGVVALRGDYDGDGRTDIAFHRPGSTWTTVPILFPRGDGRWLSANQNVPSWANQPDVRAIGPR
ncbi:MAG: VCBS repeat-containing protein, partial [Myxococcota bacterium]